jgi:glutamate synthase (NADPH/NADH) small chain
MDTYRWVALADDETCVGCRQCVRTCPFSAIEVEGPLRVRERNEPRALEPVSLPDGTYEVRAGFSSWEEALREAERCLGCPDPTCVRGCPAHNDIPGFIAALRAGDLVGAHEVLRRTSVLPDVCSRVCNQAAQCEGACTWSLAGGAPVAIGRLERFVADQLPVPPLSVPPTAAELSVGIVGSGPAGIAAAWQLLEAGAQVTVYERDVRPGGLLDWGIPDFTLPETVAARPWRQLEEAGVELRCSTEVSPADLPSLLERHDAVILANGAGEPLRLSVPGSHLEGVVDATTFLRGAKRALRPGGDREQFLSSLGLPGTRDGKAPSVLVLGAGNTAMDVARSARRLGLSALCVDWLDERFALARPDELEEARREGVEVRFCRTLVGIEGSSHVQAALLATTSQERADRRPKVLGGAREHLEVDLVVMAMGYRNDPRFSGSAPGTPKRPQEVGLPDRAWTASGVLAAPASPSAYSYPVGQLSLGREQGLWAAAFPVAERLWVAGDALVGPSTVVEAMAQGKRAALSVLAARPSRPGMVPKGAQQVLVCYESRGGKTARAAEEIAKVLVESGNIVRALPIERIGLAELATADALVIGSWVEGFVVAKVGPAKVMSTWLASLPRLGGKKAAVFCTFSVAPKATLTKMRLALEEKGAVVLGQAAFRARGLAGKAALPGPVAFAAELAQQLVAAPVPLGAAKRAY